jgi:hypothetical protein
VRNVQLRRMTAEDIDGQIEKILRGLGNPEPPIRIEDIRELQRLDTSFYASTDTGIFRETFSRLFIGVKQVLQRPMLLGDALAKLQIKALWLPDHKRILIDKTIPELKHRWVEAHEITHSILPWHAECLFGDTEQTLAPHCHEQLEGEANYGAGRLLFLGSRFFTEGSDYPLQFSSIQKLSKLYGNTLTSTLWRFVEQMGQERPLVGLVTVHPRRRAANGGPVQVCRYFIRSTAFQTQFPDVSETDLFDLIKGYCGYQGGGPLGAAKIPLKNARGEGHVFAFETFYNGHEALTFASYLEPVKLVHLVHAP